NETRLSAIRAQMNPHFLFNSLNAIQECIISEKYDSAYEYLSRFSKLLRLVLNHSEKNFISLNEELETIQLYLSLDELRFNHTFTYMINVEEDIDTNDVMVPSLLLQPFVENAIWHGLVDKEGEKKLKLSFRIKNEMIQCIIEDNGIGRKRSAWIKEQKLGANQFASRGTLLSEKRIQILNQQFSNMAQIETIDHYDPSHKSMGTSVVITLPMDIENVLCRHMIKILIIDDETAAGNILKLLLEKHITHKKEIIYTNNPVKALELLTTFKPTLVMLDIEMP